MRSIISLLRPVFSRLVTVVLVLALLPIRPVVVILPWAAGGFTVRLLWLIGYDLLFPLLLCRIVDVIPLLAIADFLIRLVGLPRRRG
ncbi:hypothetical protein ACK11Z_15380, partial [Methanoculleus bourgensis]|uniref:hypothetical protein n=1 Tax=Methanoculleus bourgensis TaxID=83986 RepID=UPI003B93EB42